ncbi:MAG: HTTM domain-containing protein [Anaerolineae bacterium]|nr:HTTM domain-containing protein [Anaerolineae bacterium]
MLKFVQKLNLFAPITAAPLAYFRIAFGLIMVWEMGRYIDAGWIDRYYVKPTFFFSYYGFEWVKPLSESGMYAVFAVFGGLAFCIMIGFAYRLAMPLFTLVFSYIFLLDQTQYLNHFYLIVLLSFLMCFIPAHRVWSVDAWFFPRLATLPLRLWMLRLLQFQLFVVYGFGALAKINPDWLQGEPMRLWLAESTDFPVFGQFFTEEWMVYLFAYGGIVVDLIALPLFCWRRTRWLGLGMLVSFHIVNARLFSIGIFPWLMLATLPLFVPLAWWERVLAVPIDLREPSLRVRQLTLSLLGVYCLFQLVMPLRHFVLPGDVHWSEEGGYFAWHMKLRDKAGLASFRVYDPISGESWLIDLDDYLTSRQQNVMTDIPDMILQFTHHLASLWRTQGYPEVQVYGVVLVSLNGREYRPVVDTQVDLATLSRSESTSNWILPLDIPLSQRRSDK